MSKSLWKRKGECDGCGLCCEIIARVELDFNENEPEWLAARGLPREGTKWFTIIDPCPQLQEDKKCGIYEDRPNTCREFPTKPDDLVELSCTYWFEHKITGQTFGGLRSPHPGLS